MLKTVLFTMPWPEGSPIQGEEDRPRGRTVGAPPAKGRRGAVPGDAAPPLPAPCLEGDATPTKLPSGAILILLIAALPIWMVNWPGVTPGHSIGTWALKPSSVLPLTRKRALRVPGPAVPW
jgi:hypothetical protein